MAAFKHSNTSSGLFGEGSQLEPEGELLRRESIRVQFVEKIVTRAMDNSMPISACDIGISSTDRDVTWNSWANVDKSLFSRKSYRLPSVSHTKHKSSFHTSQEWEGYVVEIGHKQFTARLIDITAGTSFDRDLATIPFSEISQSERKSLRIGKVFRWVIGYERSQTGVRRRVSLIHFRDIKLTQENLEIGKRWADDMLAWFATKDTAKDAIDDG